MSPLAAPDATVIRQQILDAADSRFLQYGYGKTTMAEIARDCEMSAANLYRYFDNKADLAAELARGCLGDREAQLQVIADDVATAIDARLEQWLLVSLQLTWDQWAETPRMNELVDDVCNTRGDIVQEHYSRKRGILSAMLADAAARGEIAVPDPDAVASAVLTAGITFDVPHFMHMCTLEQHQAKARELAKVLVEGMYGAGQGRSK